MSVQTARLALPTIVERINLKYPDAKYELDWENPLQLLVATILAAQCTDERVNRVTPKLFAKYPTAKYYADAPAEELEEYIRSTGFYKNKAKAIQGMCRGLVERFGGEVPRSMEELTTLDGVARKTANVVLNNAFRVASGVIVDTHVARVSRRLGLSGQKRPEKIELDLMKIVPREEWVQFGPAMVLHGRYTCTADEPQCDDCVLNDLCPKLGVDETETSEGPQAEEAAPATRNGEKGEAVKKASSRKKSETKKPARKSAASPKKTEPAAVPAAGSLRALLPADWQQALAAEFEKPYFAELEKFVAGERKNHQVFPPEADMFNAFKHTPFEAVKVLLLGQDPYHDDGQAHGLCFSVKPGVRPPPSLVNIFKELASDVGATPPGHGHLTAWADRGVLLLNAVLTVRAHEPASHKDQGWETFTDAVIKALNDRPDPVVFLLWGAYAQKKRELIDTKKHRVLTAAHPSPLSAKKFFGSKPFGRANEALEELGKEPIDWQLPPLGAAAAPPAPSVRQVTAPTFVEDAAPAAVREEDPAPVSLLADLLSSVSAARAAPDLTGLTAGLHPSWQAPLAEEFRKPYFAQLEQFLDKERAAQTVLPEADEVFAALNLTPFEQVRVVFPGDAPSEVEGESDGLAFSLRPGVRLTDELENMFQELKHDRGCWLPSSGSLAPWARQGVLLLNRVLTVRKDAAGAHQKKGWETFTEAVLRALNARARPVVFVFWDGVDRKTRSLVDAERHVVLEAPHPAAGDFVGSGLFTTINNELELRGQSAVYWQLFAM